MDPDPDPSDRRRPEGGGEARWRIVLERVALPVLAAVLAYGHALGGWFLSDDFQFLFEASRAEGWLDAATVEHSDQVAWVRPVVHWSFWIQWGASGAQAFAYHLFNLVVHACNAILVAHLASSWVRAPRAGLVAGIAFATTPLHPDAVLWISGRSDLLCTLGVLGALVGWTARCAGDRRPRTGLLALLGLVFALLSKEAGIVTLPLMLGVSAFHSRGRARARGQAGWLLGAAGLTTAYLLGRALLLRGLGGYLSGGESIQSRLDPLEAGYFYLKSLGQLVAPAHAVFWSDGRSGLWLAELGAWAGLGVLAVAGRDRARILRLGAFLALMLLASELPVASWARVNETFQNSRYLYLPSVFACIGLAALATRTPSSSGSGPRQLLPLSLTLTVLALGAYQQRVVVGHWIVAGETSARILETLPEVAPDEVLVVTGLPDSHHGAYVFRNGFRFAVQLQRGPEVRVRTPPPEEFELELERRDRDRRSRHRHYRWSPEGGWAPVD